MQCLAFTALAVTPPPRHRRVVSAAAGRPEDVENPVTEALPSTQPSSSTEGVQQTTEIIAQVTREVLRQLREDRSASPGTRDPLPVPEDDVLPATDVGTHVNLTGHPSTSSAEDQMDGAVAGAINTLLRGDVGGNSTADGTMAPSTASPTSCSTPALAPVMVRLLNGALSEGTKKAYRRAVTSYADFILWSTTGLTLAPSSS
ncbi:hypothetical protein LSAT2_033110 [Lamellibrachia satsuma]|nr:hypothetical protein LSAT2_033110 [Lamellibrachia satsuma]